MIQVSTRDAVRDLIETRLLSLVNELDAFEQTTHGRAGGNTIKDVASTLQACYENPTAFTISDLSQAIQGFLKEN